ncbi:unnamed protein product [Rodentolepis nana]|uniref:Glyco_trans_2-like domain-containing protein n=1 Tax=Rodentolepis nana TaxID=102285 RepID=A0A0R3T3N0_RODNA|nr:unnamed protein product [Rodentolepis nana]
MRYFASASFGKFLTSDVPIISETADRTQATISTACTSWLSSVGAGVGLPINGLLFNSGIADLCELIMDKLLPIALSFVMSSDRDISNPFDDIVLALFRPLMTFFSGELVNGDEQSPGLALKIVDIMVGEEDFTNSETVKKHIEKISLCISDILVLRTLCEILCSALQDTNLTAINGRSITSSDYLDEVILQLTQSGKQFDSIIRQLGDRIAEVAIGHSKFFCLDTSSKRSFDELLEALNTEYYDHSTLSTEEAQDELSLEKWSCFMDEIWKTTSSAVPAGLTRQIYARIVSEVLKFVAQKVANQHLSTSNEISDMSDFIWGALKTTHKLIFRCADSESEILGHGLLSNDLQNIHCSALMLTQCLIVIGGPNEIINRLHGEGFYSGLENGVFRVSFNPNNWLKIVDPERFYIASKETQDLSDIRVLEVDNELPEPVWIEALVEFIGNRMISIFQKVCDLAIDRVLVTEIGEDFVNELSSVTSKEPDLCSFSPDSTLRIKEIVNGIYSSALEFLPPKLLTFFNQRDVTLIRNRERQGLIRSRLIGVNLASGKVLIFSDSHIKFEPNWLEALLIRLISYESEEVNPRLLILSPFISAFTEDDLVYPAAEYLRGGFNWDLSFTWEPMSDEEKDSLNTHGRLLNFTWLSLPRPTPVLAGSVIATLASPFKSFGAFDKNMSIWGGENIEISLRAWMCGGRVEIIPCSRVSHLFRSSHGYTFPNGKVATVMRNLNRVARVWMQPSRSLQIKSVKYRVPPIALFYSAQQEAFKVPAGDISSRQRLRQLLECKDFAWFVENIYPDLLRKAVGIKLKDSAMIHAQRSSIISKLLD